jgi:hypothetical protein
VDLPVYYELEKTMVTGINAYRGGENMRDMYGKLNSLRSQREAGESFNFSGAIYTIIPNDGGEPKFMQPLGKKQATCDLVSALYVAKKNNDLVIAAWVGSIELICF